MGPITFLLGHCGIHALTRLPSPAWGAVTFLLLAVLAWAVFACTRRFRRQLLWLCALLLGTFWAWSHAAVRLADDLSPQLEGVDLRLHGRVASLPDSDGADPQFVFDVHDAPKGVPSRVRLTWYRATVQPQPGEMWELTVRLKRRSGFANPGGFDYEGFLFRAGIGATGYVREDEGNRLLRSPSYSYGATRLRAWIAARIAAAVGSDPMLGILQGLAVGDTQAMTPEQWRVFGATGTTHLMAISGLHVGMVAMLAAWLGGAIARWPHAQSLRLTAMHGQVIAGILAAVVYSTLAGLSIPTQRTLVVLCVCFVARWQRRPIAFGHTLGLALVAVLIVDPFAPLAPGAWLSFGAVAIILLAVSGRLVREGVVASFTRVQWAITIGLTPVLLVAFGSLSLVAPLANALAIPLFTIVIVPAVLLGALAAAADVSSGALVFAVPVWLLHACWPVLQWLAEQPQALWHFPQPPLLVFMALLMGALLLVLPGIWPTRLAGALLCLPVMFHRPPGPRPGEFEIAVLDVGQGLAVVVRTHAHTLLYDTGPAFRTGRDAAELAVLPYLRHRGIRAVDALVVSHGDLDHRGGMASMIAALPVAQILVGPSVVPMPERASQCQRNQRWVWEGVTFEVLHPGASSTQRADDNNSSCVLLVRSQAHIALLTGDIEMDAEQELLSRGMERADVVIAPHHGSDTSSSAQFVGALSPDVVIFSAGYRNRWNFPRSEVVARWRSAGARTFSTVESGAVEVSLGSQRGPELREHRRASGRYWHRQ